ncbi:hypothetical protein [Bradyrhizobium sp. CSS354]|nr:hypothetical protein [Bradyrhizobium sp. CSS354]MDE5462209.1 hypothetical protein [Bradyrhizobium sp. CSS354]
MAVVAQRDQIAVALVAEVVVIAMMRLEGTPLSAKAALSLRERELA